MKKWKNEKRIFIIIILEFDSESEYKFKKVLILANKIIKDVYSDNYLIKL